MLSKLKHGKAKTPTASSASLHQARFIEDPVPAAPVIEAPAPEAPVEEAPVTEAPVDEAPATDPDAANTTYEEVVTFTTLEDYALIGMKSQKMSWAEISAAMPDKGEDFLKLRYLDLYEAAHGDLTNGGEGSSTRPETQPKSILKNRSVQIQEAADSDSDNSDEDSFIDPAPPVFSPMHEARPEIVINPSEVSCSALYCP